MGVLLTSGTGLQLETFLGYGDTILQWFIDSFGTIISFLVANPALLTWAIVSLAGAAFIYFKKFI